jgi:hypothetical protein
MYRTASLRGLLFIHLLLIVLNEAKHSAHLYGANVDKRFARSDRDQSRKHLACPCECSPTSMLRRPRLSSLQGRLFAKKLCSLCMLVHIRVCGGLTEGVSCATVFDAGNARSGVPTVRIGSSGSASKGFCTREKPRSLCAAAWTASFTMNGACSRKRRSWSGMFASPNTDGADTFVSGAAFDRRLAAATTSAMLLATNTPAGVRSANPLRSTAHTARAPNRTQ